MNYTTADRVQKFLDEKYGEKKFLAFSTTGVLIAKPEWMNYGFKTTVAPFGSFYRITTGADSALCSIFVYHEQDMDLSDFNDFVEPPINIKVLDQVSDDVYGRVYRWVRPITLWRVQRLMGVKI